MATALFEKFKITQNVNEKKNLLNKTEFYANKAINILPDYVNGNIMMLGVVSERYKLDNDINNYIKGMKPIILRRPDIPFIKEFSEYIKDRGHDAELFPFYLEVGTELLKFNDGKRNFGIQFLNYAYQIRPTSKQVNEALGLAYELSGNMQESLKYKTAAQSLQ